MAKLVIVRCLLAVATSMKWELHQMDVNNALYGDLDEKIYMLLPPGYDKCRPGDSYQLHKSI